MAAIVISSSSAKPKDTLAVGATTTRTFWLARPVKARGIQVFLSVTAAGTNTIFTAKSGNPITKDDTSTVPLMTGATITAISDHRYVMGPFVAIESADGAAANTDCLQNTSLPELLGLTVTPTGSTYSLYYEWLY